MTRRSRNTRKPASAAKNATPGPGKDESDADKEGKPMEDASMVEDNNSPLQDSDVAVEGEGVVTPDEESDAASRHSTPARRGGTRRRRAGKGSRGRVHEVDDQEELDSKEDLSDKGTPRRRGGWRGGPRSSWGGRWARSRAGASQANQVPLDNEGNMANVKDDEVELPEDPEGEAKVDKMGHLQDGREYRVRVFTISGKGDRLYMLSTEPARCIGFRDSYLFFQKHRTLFKVILAEESKRDLIDRDVIPHSYKGRSIGVVTARSVFREFGARIVIGGKKIIDDYQVAAARANGDIEGELAVPDDRIPTGAGDAYDRNQYVAWHGASNVYHFGQPTVPLQGGKAVDVKKRKVMVTGANWMLEHAREASRYNASLSTIRRKNFKGVYDVHTNMVHSPKIMQPSHAKWVEVSQGQRASDGHRTLPRLLEGPGASDDDDQSLSNASNFPSVAPILARNFLITDVYYHTPPHSLLGNPGSDEPVWNIDPLGLTHVPDDVLAELPSECLPSFQDAVRKQSDWKSTWQGEAADADRASLQITYNNVS